MRFLVLVFLLAPFSVQAATVTFLTSGSSYSTPGDWNNSDNSIECIGAGGDGAGGGTTAGSKGAGGGGGAYAKIVNQTLAGSIPYSIATGGSEVNTTFNTTVLVCDAGNNASATVIGTGGTTAASTGTTEFAGGDGDTGNTNNDGGGGGAGGTTGAGSTASISGGGDGGATSGGVGGAAILSPAINGNIGGNGTVWQVSPARGAGGGGSGGGNCDTADLLPAGNGGDGGNFGGGGGGGGMNFFGCSFFGDSLGGAGADGIIVTTYTPAAVPSGAVVSGLKLGAFGSLKITGGGLKIK